MTGDVPLIWIRVGRTPVHRGRTFEIAQPAHGGRNLIGSGRYDLHSARHVNGQGPPRPRFGRSQQQHGQSEHEFLHNLGPARKKGKPACPTAHNESCVGGVPETTPHPLIGIRLLQHATRRVDHSAMRRPAIAPVALPVFGGHWRLCVIAAAGKRRASPDLLGLHKLATVQSHQAADGIRWRPAVARSVSIVRLIRVGTGGGRGWSDKFS